MTSPRTQTLDDLFLRRAGSRLLEQPDLTITVVSWNTKDLLRQCLQSIESGSGDLKLEVHIVDNASSDGSDDMVRDEFPRYQLITNRENVGFARANNQSWTIARGRYWLLLNSDAEVRANALYRLIQFMDEHPQAGLATARLLNADGSPQHCAQAIPKPNRVLIEAFRLHKFLSPSTRGNLLQGPYWSYDRSGEVGWTWGTALIARRQAVEEVGPLSEEYFMYGEDLEWCLRMRRGGWSVWYCAEAEVWHHSGQSSKQRWTSVDRQKVIETNVLKAIRMHRGAGYARLLKASNNLASSIERLRRGKWKS